MRLLHVDTGRDMRGGQWQALHLINGLSVRGVEQLLLAPAHSELLLRARRDGIAADPLSSARLRLCARRRDLVHAHTAAAHTLCALWSRTPIVVSRRVAFPVKRGILSRWKYARAARYIAISEAVAADLLSAGIPSTKISVVHDGVPLPPRSSSLDGPLLAPYSDDPLKGMSAAAAAAARARVPIRFSHDLPTDLATARVFLYLTALEGLGSAALLAMAYGIPVVASRVGGLPEAVVHDETGLLVDTEEQAAAALRRLWDDPHLGSRMGAAGRARVERLFTVNAMLEGTLSAYEKTFA